MTNSMLLFITVANLSFAQAYVAPGAIAHEGPSQAASLMRPKKLAVHDSEHAQEATAASSWNPLVFGMALGLFASAVFSQSPAAFAADSGNGQAVFAANCASCHAGGNNAIVPDKKLKKESLQQYGKYETSAIATQVSKGLGSMPAFGAKLSPEDVNDVAAYVREQADKGW